MKENKYMYFFHYFILYMLIYAQNLGFLSVPSQAAGQCTPQGKPRQQYQFLGFSRKMFSAGRSYQVCPGETLVTGGALVLVHDTVLRDGTVLSVTSPYYPNGWPLVSVFTVYVQSV